MFELIYTSYPRGLQSGTSGFTSVAYTEGIPKIFIQLCESLSGYPFIYPLGHPMYHLNPEIFTHYRFKVNSKYRAKADENHKNISEGDYISILSRISSSGEDYTGRENKIAHHIILDSNDRLLFDKGPAWAMMHSDLFVDHWNKEPSTLPQRSVDEQKKLPEHNLLKTDNWLNIFGDAGSSGFLVRSAQESPDTPSFILFDQVQQRGICLPLLVEAMDLIVPEKRWEITFNTYFISKHMDSDCLWRCCDISVLNANKTTKQLSVQEYIKRYPDSIIIDICTKTVHGKKLQKNSEFSTTGSTPTPTIPDISLSDIHCSSNGDTGSLSEKNSETQDFKANSTFQDPSKKSLWKNLSLGTIFICILFILFSYYSPWSKKLHDTVEQQQDIVKESSEERVNSQTEISEGKIAVTGQNESYDKKMDFGFYDDMHQIASDSSAFEDMKCRIIQNNGMEINLEIEKPITNDTPNWTITDQSSVEPVGYISTSKLWLYDTKTYSAIYFDSPLKKNSDLIWIAPLKLKSSMISKGVLPDTLEIRITPEMSGLLPGFFSRLPSQDLSVVIELKHIEENSIQLNGDNPQNSETSAQDSEVDLQNPAKRVDSNNEKKSRQTISLHPVCSFKSDKDSNLTLIELKFSDSEFKTLLEKNSYLEEHAYNKPATSTEQHDIASTNANPEKEALYPFRSTNPFKEFKINYKHSQNDKIYTILCFTCEMDTDHKGENKAFSPATTGDNENRPHMNLP